MGATEAAAAQAPARPQLRDLRRTINGVLWILRTGAPWRNLPTYYGS